jgi:chromosome segregation ATPase
MKIQLNVAVWAACFAAIASALWVWRMRDEDVARLRVALRDAESRAQSNARRAGELEAESRRLRAHASEVEAGKQQLVARAKALSAEAAEFRQRADIAEAEVKRLRELSKAPQSQATA